MAVTKAQLEAENKQLRSIARELLDVVRSPAKYGLTIKITPERGPGIGTKLMLEAMIRRARSVINGEAVR